MKFLICGFLLLIGFGAFSQQQIFATVSGGDLYCIDVQHCERHLVGPTGQAFGDIAFTPNGQLWGIAGGKLYSIDTTNANTVLIGNTGIGGISLVGLNDTTLLTEFGMNLYAINTTNASSSLIGTIGYSATGDLVFYGNSLYMVTPFVKIDLNNSYTSIVSVTPINLSLPGCEGAAIYDGEYTSIIGFNGPNLIKICQIDGSYEMICPDLNLGGTPGAASISRNKGDNNSVNVFTPNNDGVNDLFQPIGDLNHLKSLIIVNRWGIEIQNLTYPFVWDGTSEKGENQEEGVYFYVLEESEGCNNTIQKQGMIHLFR